MAPASPVVLTSALCIIQSDTNLTAIADRAPSVPGHADGGGTSRTKKGRMSVGRRLRQVAAPAWAHRPVGEASRIFRNPLGWGVSFSARGAAFRRRGRVFRSCIGLSGRRNRIFGRDLGIFRPGFRVFRLSGRHFLRSGGILVQRVGIAIQRPLPQLPRRFHGKQRTLPSVPGDHLACTQGVEQFVKLHGPADMTEMEKADL